MTQYEQELRECIWFLLKSMQTPAAETLEAEFYEMNRKAAIGYALTLLNRPPDRDKPAL